jgi:hypothetical protein
MSMTHPISANVGGLFVVWLGAGACMDLDRSREATAANPAWPQVALEPAEADGRLASVPRIVVRFNGPAADPSEGMLFEGALSAHDLQQLAQGDVGDALQARRVPTLAWLRTDRQLVVAPTTLLGLGQKYTLAIPRLGWRSAMLTVDQDPAPMLKRIWPPPQQAATASVGIWCLSDAPSGDPDPMPSQILWLQPANVAGLLQAGGLEGMGAGCMRWTSLQGGDRGPLMPPATMILPDGRYARVEPTVLQALQQQEPVQEAQCDSVAQGFGPGCAQVWDDRVRVVAGGPPLWMGLEIAALRRVGVLDDEHSMMIRPLPVDQPLQGVVRWLDVAGRLGWAQVQLRTKPAMAHVVLNEVMANPAGKEPDQEWVELYNDGTGAVQLQGWSFEDQQATVSIPAYEMAPGSYVLLVPLSYERDSLADSPPAPGTVVLRMTSLGKRGLSNSGERVGLRDAAGREVSVVPAIPSPRQGTSIARIAPDAPDQTGASFVMWPDGGTPGASNIP